jgi:tRNA dimethylallyltransferase
LADVRLPVIVGPTAAGKSRIALTLARESGAWIVSADSRQIYRGFDIGTAKPSPNEMADVPHAGIDVADPGERYSARRFADLARGVLARAMEQGRPCLVVGGTGFYIKALVQPLATLPELDPHRHAASLVRTTGPGAQQARTHPTAARHRSRAADRRTAQPPVRPTGSERHRRNRGALSPGGSGAVAGAAH